MQNPKKQYPNIISIIRDAEQMEKLAAKIKAGKLKEHLILLDIHN